LQVLLLLALIVKKNCSSSDDYVPIFIILVQDFYGVINIRLVAEINIVFCVEGREVRFAAYPYIATNSSMKIISKTSHSD